MNSKIKHLAIKWLFELIIPAIIIYTSVIATAQIDDWYFMLMVPAGLILIALIGEIYYKHFKEDETEQDKD